MEVEEMDGRLPNMRKSAAEELDVISIHYLQDHYL